MLKKIAFIYRDADITIRQQAPGLLLTLLFVLSGLTLTVVSDLIFWDPVSFAAQLFMVSMLVVSLVLLFRGRFKTASVITSIIMTVGLGALTLHFPDFNPVRVFQGYLYVMGPVVLTVVLAYTWRTTLIAAAVGFAVTIVRYFFILRPNIPAESPDFAILNESILVGSVLYCVMSLFLIYIIRTKQTSMAEMERNRLQSESTVNKIADVVEAALVQSKEFKLLTNDFQQISNSLAGMAAATETISAQIGSLAATISSVNESVENSKQESHSFMDQVEDTDKVVQESTASVNEMSASLDSVAGIIESRTESTNALKGLIRQGRDEVESTQASFSQVLREMQTLQEVNSIVANIASMTNLLSMNAAIEAAHAGDAGRGFAVVAEEIRKLASSTAENSDLISRNLSDLTGSISSTGTSLEKAHESMSEIEEQIRFVSESFEEIRHSSSELSEGGRIIISAMAGLRTSSTRIREGSQTVAENQEQIHRYMNAVHELSQQVDTGTAAIASLIASTKAAVSDIEDRIAENRKSLDSLFHSVEVLKGDAE